MPQGYVTASSLGWLPKQRGREQRHRRRNVKPPRRHSMPAERRVERRVALEPRRVREKTWWWRFSVHHY
jgi:hypothetical protein